MKIFISDTNVFIDLISVDLFEAFLELPVEIQTNDFVLFELSDKQREVVQLKIADQKIILNLADEDELYEIKKLHKTQKGLSIQDISVFFHARKNKASILTGDKAFKNYATNNGIECRGVLWAFDEIAINNLEEKSLLAEKLEYLITINTRLPKKECEERITKWRNF